MPKLEEDMTLQGKQGYRFLIVEDNCFAMDIMATFLVKRGFRVDLAENGAVGLAKYLANPLSYHLIFMDLQMKVMNGYEAARRIRSSGMENAVQIPIVAMSGKPLDDVESRHFQGCLRKPFALQLILSFIEELLC